MATSKAQHQAQKANAPCAERGAAPQTPEAVRDAFLARRVQVGHVELQPLSIATLWMLEEVNHPIGQAIQGKAATLSLRDTASAIFIFSDPAAALQTWREGEAAFNKKVFSFARFISPEELAEIIKVIRTLIQEGLAKSAGWMLHARREHLESHCHNWCWWLSNSSARG